MDLGERISSSSTSDLRNALFSVELLSEARTKLAGFFSILLGMGNERTEKWQCLYGNRRSFCATMGQFLQVAGLAGPGEVYTFRPSCIRRKGHNHAVDS
jgi:hypothetical protein